MRRLSHFLAALALLALAGCGFSGTPPGSKTTNPGTPTQPSQPSQPTQPTSPANIAVSVTPSSASVRAGATQTFTATVSGSSNTSVSWQVNAVAGGSASVGTINSSGVYTAPASVPSNNIVTVTAVSAASASTTGSSSVTLLNPIPTLTSIAPASVSTGSFTLTVRGTGFVAGAEVLLGGSAMGTTFVSSTQLTATGTENSAGSYSVE